tara:strand:+ start:1216 stop:1830 length:615 start_codon:yes stop_codon:yes gene_type:complete
MAFQGVGTGFNITAASTAALSPCIPHKTPYLRVNTGVGTVHVAIGTFPTAVVTDTVITNQQPEVISLGQPISQSISEVTVPALQGAGVGIATLTVPEGYGSQFIKGNLIGLEVVTGTGSTDDQTYWNLTNLYVYDVQLKSRENGYNDKLVVTGDLVTQNGQTAGIATALMANNHLTARKAFKMSAYTGGVEGPVYAQQVQVTGG